MSTWLAFAVACVGSALVGVVCGLWLAARVSSWLSAMDESEYESEETDAHMVL